MEAGRTVGADCDIPTRSNGLTVEDRSGFDICAGQNLTICTNGFSDACGESDIKDDYWIYWLSKEMGVI